VAFTDTFTEAVNTNLEDHTPSGGTAWTLVAGVAGAAIAQATTNVCRPKTTTLSYYICDDQGSADHFTQALLYGISPNFPNAFVAARLVDSSNFIGFRCYGTGSSGLRLTQVVGGVATDLKTFQGIAGHTYKVEVIGTDAEIYDNGTKVTGGPYTINAALAGETSQGLVISSSATTNWIGSFRAESLGGGAQTLTPSLFSNSNTFYSPTVSRGAVTLTPSLFTSATNAFYSATVTQGGATQTLIPSLFSNSQSFYSATLTLGGVSLSPPLLTNGQTFYVPTVTPGSVTLTPSLFTSSTNAFYAPTVTQEGGPQYLTVPLVSNTSAFYAPTVTPGAITVTPDLFANAQTFYAATVSQGAPGQTLEPELFSSANQFFTAIVTVGGVTLTPSLFTNSNTFYAHLLTGGDTVNALMSAPRTGTYRNTSSATRSNLQTARRPKA